MDTSILSKEIHQGNAHKRIVITAVQHIADWTLQLTFSDGIIKNIDFEQYLKDTVIYHRFLKPALFMTFHIMYGNLHWKGNTLDFHSTTLYKWQNA